MRPKALIERARAATSLDDLGEDSFREGLERLIASADAEAALNDAGRVAFDGTIVHLLSCRLQVEHWYARHPEIDEQEIIAPLIGLGLPRTGSTYLGCLLAEDPAVRFLRTWEAAAPCPPPTRATEHDDPRIAMAERSMAQRDALFPRMKIMLPTTATGPTECQMFMGYDFKAQLFQATARLPSYVDWLVHEADLVPTYRYVKRVLKLLQWRCPPTRWRLKSPSHSMFITALDEVFPDARYWMTHRDVGKVLPSMCELYRELSGPYCDDLDLAFIGRQNLDWIELGMKRVLAFRDAGHDDRFFDVQFAPLQKEPLSTLERLYGFLGEEFSEESRTRMATWQERMPRGGDGRIDYRPQDFALDMTDVRRVFRFYSDRFGIVTSD